MDTGPNSILNSVLAVAFSPDSKLLATGDAVGTVQLWDTATGALVGAPLLADTGPDGTVNNLAFSPDGKLLATMDNDDNANGTVRLWQIPLFTDPYAALCTSVGPPTREEWDQYAPGEPFPQICK